MSKKWKENERNVIASEIEAGLSEKKESETEIKESEKKESESEIKESEKKESESEIKESENKESEKLLETVLKDIISDIEKDKKTISDKEKEISDLNVKCDFSESFRNDVFLCLKNDIGVYRIFNIDKEGKKTTENILYKFSESDFKKCLNDLKQLYKSEKANRTPKKDLSEANKIKEDKIKEQIKALKDNLKAKKKVLFENI